jgi:uncharacterized protein (TIGR02145 family)
MYIPFSYWNNICGDCIEQDVIIGTQTWMKCNLNVETYSDGTSVPQVTDQATWDTLTTGAWCYYNNDSANGLIYGKLYNWYAVAGIYDSASAANPLLRKKLGPVGYHVPSKTEVETLFNFIDPGSGGGTVFPNTVGSALKERGNCHWLQPNTDATNSTRFTAFGGGYRVAGNEFFSITELGVFFTSTERNLLNAYGFYMGSSGGNVAFFDEAADYTKLLGSSVRLIKD